MCDLEDRRLETPSPPPDQRLLDLLGDIAGEKKGDVSEGELDDDGGVVVVRGQDGGMKNRRGQPLSPVEDHPRPGLAVDEPGPPQRRFQELLIGWGRVEDPGFEKIIKEGGRAAQEAAMANPTAYDRETSDLLEWFDIELARRAA